MERLKAIIKEGVVTSVVVVNPNSHEAIDGVLVPVGAACGVGYTYNGVNFLPPPPTPLTTEQLAKENAVAAVKAEAVIQYLLTRTPAECDAYIRANVTSLATATNMLAKLAMALCVIAKETIR